MTFRDFTIEEFLQDPVFRKWVLEQDAEAANFWSAWQRQHPDKREELDKAREMLLLIGGGPSHAPAAQDEKETWDKVLQSIATATQHMPGSPRIKTRSLRRWMPYAAVLSGVLIAAFALFLLNRDSTVHYATRMGEMKTIELPDHSVVRLNVNSTLRYAKDWDGNGPREIWLGGEAFFTVRHQQDNRRFIVHTDDVNIQVVGTEFNVNTRRVKTQVVLRNGVVKLTLKKAENGAVPITMQPGDMVTYSAATAELTNKKVNPEVYASWRNRVLLFNDTPVAEVIRSLQDNLGLTILLEDEALGAQTFTGSIPMNDITVFFKTLARSFDVHIEKTGVNTYVISKTKGE
ncbi:FecR domain-containing protein [Chitinophaga japonensis]|uniref:FecR family protein n=1 Tax=Chitinophaga japonensis TaxID=104662 RepID=A0A562SIV7_CHIJA|nr:FecR domain-containing protein [Chitinophaga japonensis]TWI80924.1 FecR family protein [Chitinophaga japonensis]